MDNQEFIWSGLAHTQVWARLSHWRARNQTNGKGATGLKRILDWIVTRPVSMRPQHNSWAYWDYPRVSASEGSIQLQPRRCAALTFISDCYAVKWQMLQCKVAVRMPSAFRFNYMVFAAMYMS